MTMAADARKEVSERPTTSKRRCRKGARAREGGPNSSSARVLARPGSSRAELPSPGGFFC